MVTKGIHKPLLKQKYYTYTLSSFYYFSIVSEVLQLTIDSLEYSLPLFWPGFFSSYSSLLPSIFIHLNSSSTSSLLIMDLYLNKAILIGRASVKEEMISSDSKSFARMKFSGQRLRDSRAQFMRAGTNKGGKGKMKRVIAVSKTALRPAYLDLPQLIVPERFWTVMPSKSSFWRMRMRLAAPAKDAARQFRAALAIIMWEPWSEESCDQNIILKK